LTRHTHTHTQPFYGALLFAVNTVDKLLFLDAVLSSVHG